MNRTVKDATTKVFHYETTQALCAHVLAFVAAYNFAKHLKALRWRTPFQVICDAWKTDPASFKINPHHLTPGLYRRQYTGSAGSPKREAFAAGITNCQIGVFAAYVSRHGHAFVDRALYLPKAWTDDSARLAAAHVPADIGFATKPQLARRMAERAMASGVPFAWVTADTVHGVSELEMALRRAGKGYVLGVPRTQGVWSSGTRPDVSGTAEDVAATLDPAAWRRLSASAGTKGPRVYDWAYVELGDLDAQAQGYAGSHGLWTRGLLARRSIADGARVLRHVVPGWHGRRHAGRRRRSALGHRG